MGKNKGVLWSISVLFWSNDKWHTFLEISEHWHEISFCTLNPSTTTVSLTSGRKWCDTKLDKHFASFLEVGLRACHPRKNPSHRPCHLKKCLQFATPGLWSWFLAVSSPVWWDQDWSICAQWSTLVWQESGQAFIFPKRASATAR